jgi:tetratricopeptide (TPR) repeat protein
MHSLLTFLVGYTNRFVSKAEILHLYGHSDRKIKNKATAGNFPIFTTHFIFDSMRILFQILAVFLFVIPIFSQNKQQLDSLELRLTLEKDPVLRINLLEKISRNLIYLDIQKARKYAEEAHQIANDTENKAAQIRCTLLLSEISWSKTDYTESMRLAIVAIGLSEENNDRRSLAGAYVIIGTIYLRLDNYNKSLEYYFKSLKIFREIEDDVYISIVLNNLGSVFTDQKKYEKAIEYFTKSLAISESIQDSVRIELCMSNIASVLSASGELEKAKKMMLTTMHLHEGEPLRRWLGINLMNLSIVYSKLNQYDSASILFEKALPYFDQLDDESKKALFYLHYGNFFFETKDFEKSLLNGGIAYNISRKYGFPDVTIKSAKLLRDTYLELNNMNEAFKYALVEIKLKDSLNLERNSAKTSNYELQYQFDIERQEKKLAQQSKDFILVVIIILFISVIAVGVLLFSRQQEKAKNIWLYLKTMLVEYFGVNYKNEYSCNTSWFQF